MNWGVDVANKSVAQTKATTSKRSKVAYANVGNVAIGPGRRIIPRRALVCPQDHRRAGGMERDEGYKGLYRTGGGWEQTEPASRDASKQAYATPHLPMDLAVKRR